MPTHHGNNVTRDRSILIYNILKGIKFNAGEIICAHIKLKVKEDKVRQLWFPTLITELYRLTAVAVRADDSVTRVGHHITETVVEVNIKVVEDHPPKPAPPRPRREEIDIGRVNGGVNTTLLYENSQYMKEYQICQHLYIVSEFKGIRKILERVQHKCKIPLEEEVNAFQGQFDDEGYL
ncbi:hypothetical protein KSP40_PGU013140 [Platanthera guangdongensis]|uniref:Uncharacterized protein n=1 Tax=Platanthera guangdongensis TaxID=2320717 RepID=A0ABR2M6C9_9ASPA